MRDGLAIASAGKDEDATWTLADGQESSEQHRLHTTTKMNSSRNRKVTA